ncbi:MAG: CHAD domain-containing protein [Acidobacteria bacterium]|nr:CHAD domain-containing protein [Acidobacteriota bacterium]
MASSPPAGRARRAVKKIASPQAPPVTTPAVDPPVAALASQEAALRKPVTQIPVARFAQRQAADRLRRVIAEVEQTLRSPDEEAVHQLRVSSRRLRAALDIFRPYFAPPERAQVKQEIRALFAVAGEVRNRDIACGLLAQDAPQTTAYLQQERLLWSMRLTEHLRQMVHQEFGTQWRTAIETPRPEKKPKGRLPPGALLPEAAERWLPPLARRFFKTGREAFATGDAEHLHEFRIAAKRFRYGLEFFAPLYGPRFLLCLRQLKKLQDSLGRLNDLVTTRTLVPVPEITALLAARETLVRDALTECWENEFRAGAVSGSWVQYLRHYAGRTKAAQASRPPRKAIPAAPAGIPAPAVAKRRA